MRKIIVIMLLSLWILPSIGNHAQESDRLTPDEICANVVPAPDPNIRQFAAPKQVLETGIDYAAVFCTESGAIFVDLFETLAPQTVNSFVFLAQNGFYNNTTFHRVLQNFMAQGGDPTGTGTGGPGYTVVDEYVSFMRFDRPGLLATANSNNRQANRFNTNGSQFFITTVVTDWLDYNHTIFGEVMSGQDVVLNLRLRDPQVDTTPGASLYTVVIVERDSVANEYEPPTAATQADFEALLSNLDPLNNVEVNTNLTGVFSLEQTVSLMPLDVQADATTLLSENNFLFSASVQHDNAICDLDNLPIVSIREWVLVFKSKADAIAAQTNDAFVTTFMTEGHADFTQTTSNYYGLPIYSWDVTACNVPATQSRMVRQLGRMLIITETISSLTSGIVVEEWFDQLTSGLYDVIFEAVFRPEANQ